MQHKEVIKQWIDLADMDLALSQHSAKTMRPTPHEIICFHCQQFTEKYLKAFLISKGIEPPYTHDLVKLLSLCEAENAIFSEIKERCAILTEYGVQPRYSADMRINEDDMKRALHYAEVVKSFFLEKMSELFETA